MLVAAVGAAVASSAGVGATWSGESSLAVFDREPVANDDPAGKGILIARILAVIADEPTSGGGELELRWIGAPGGFQTYAALWSGSDSSTVCVVVTSALEAASSCVPEADFDDEGIRIETFGLDIRWGPTGAELWANSSG